LNNKKEIIRVSLFFSLSDPYFVLALALMGDYVGCLLAILPGQKGNTLGLAARASIFKSRPYRKFDGKAQSKR
jgi:hypothetical protein